MRRFLENNYHTHTYRCQHAFGTEREYIETAIGMGIKQLGFSDHVPCSLTESFVPGMRMTFLQAEEYVDTLRKLAHEYKNQIEILIGFEAEYSKQYYPEQKEMADRLGIDYMIIGQHFLVDDDGHVLLPSPTDDRKLLRTYMQSLIEGMQTGSYAYIAHPDFVEFTGRKEEYEEECRDFCRQAKLLQIPLEINMQGMSAGKRYPQPAFWEIAGEVGNDVIIGADAHTAQQLENVEIYDKCMELVRRYHLHLIGDLNG